MLHGLSKQERICSVGAIEALVSNGRYIAAGPLKCCFVKSGRDQDQSFNRMMVSVSKKYFKRAVKRNLLKRRIREAYRLQKELLPERSIDMMFIYASKEVADFQTIMENVKQLLGIICKRTETK